MNIYKYVKGVILLSCFVLLSSCQGLLNRKPESSLTQKTYFKNENDLKLYANKLYSSLPTETPDKDNNSDDMVPQTPNQFLAGNYTIPVTGGGYTFSNIRYCNYFLDHYQKANIKKNIKKKYAAEIRFFRAWQYWDKVKRFGAVPWISHALQDTSAALYKARTPHKIVMDSVLADLNFAVKYLPLPSQADAGRLNTYIASALKGRICLWEGTYRKYHKLGDQDKFLKAAVKASQRIMKSENYHLYSTGNPHTDYHNMFLQKKLQGEPETIMAKKYIKDILTHNVSRTLNESGTGWSLDFINSFLCADGKPIDKSPLYKGNDSLSATVANRDPRLKQMVATKGDTVLGNSGAPQVLTLPRVGTGITSTGYEVTKMKSNKTVQWVANQSDLDLFIFRYDEQLLIYAEAKAELANDGVGTISQADLDKSINLIRNRVGMPHMKMDVSIDPIMAKKFPAVKGSYKNVILEIRRERRVETAGEGFRFDDLLRWKAGKLIDNPKTILGLKLVPAIKAKYPSSQVSRINLNDNNFVEPYPSIKQRHWNDKMYHYPIPTQELTLNENIKQNPGW
jgi:hypothetical protein